MLVLQPTEFKIIPLVAHPSNTVSLMQIKHYKTPLLTAGLMLAFYIISQHFYVAGQFTHTIIDIFAGGRSSVKVLLFFGFTILLCLTTLILYFEKIRSLRIKSLWLFSAIGITFIYNLSLLIAYCYKFGLNLRDLVITFHTHEISSTTLLHNHVMKGVNATLLKPFGLALNENVDTGLVFLGLLPQILFWIGGILVLISAILLILKFLELFYTRQEEHKRWQGLFIIIYAIISFSLLKNMLDGGIFSREALIALSGLICIILIHGKIATKKLWWSIAPLALFIPASILSWHLFQSYAAMISVFIIFLTTLLYWLYSERITRLGILLAILTCTALYVPLSETYNLITKVQKPISAEGAYIGLYNDPVITHQASWKLVEKIHNLDIYKVTPDPAEASKLTVRQIADENHLLVNIGPITTPWESCMPESPPQTVTFTVASPETLREDKHTYQFGYITKVEELGKTKGLNRYNITMMLSPCAPRVLNIAQELLSERGLKTFFILNISDLNAGV